MKTDFQANNFGAFFALIFQKIGIWIFGSRIFEILREWCDYIVLSCAFDSNLILELEINPFLNLFFGHFYEFSGTIFRVFLCSNVLGNFESVVQHSSWPKPIGFLDFLRRVLGLKEWVKVRG